MFDNLLGNVNRFGFLALLIWSISESCSSCSAFQPTPDPPLLDSPTYSLATLNEDGTTNMNILTYATPSSIRPDRIWSLSLFRETLTHDNLVRNKKCVLQLLTEDHAELVTILGGFTGTEVDKEQSCAGLGFKWEDLGNESGLKVLPGCAHCLYMTNEGEMIEAGSHLLVPCCKVKQMYKGNTQSKHLMTGRLRELGIITELGRVAEDKRDQCKPTPRTKS